MDHINICLNENIEADYNYWNDISLIHKALPEIDINEIDMSTKLFDKNLKAPIIISAITGGCEDAKKINENLAVAAEKLGIGIGVGSQRASLKNPSLSNTYSVINKYKIPLKIANIGLPQLIDGSVGMEEAKKAMREINADLLAIHLNYLQEIVQPEGDHYAKNGLKKIKEISKELPVLIKESGAGISKDVANMLKKTNIRGIDTGGLSGTSFSAVEYYRAKDDKLKKRLGKTFWNWGIPTPISILEVNGGLPVIATGGIRTGLDVAKALILGADACGIALPLLDPATRSSKEVVEKLELIIEELRACMFLLGSKNISKLKENEVIIEGKTRTWCETRGLLR